MNNKKRRYKGKRPLNEYRDSNLRSVSTNIEKKEVVVNNTAARDYSNENNNPSKFNRKNKKRPNNNPQNRDPLPNRQNEQRVNNNLGSRNIYSQSNRNELKRSFLKSELMRYIAPKIKKTVRSNIDRKKLAPYLTEGFDSQVCHICNKNITNMATVIYDDEHETYSHFDCVYDKVKERHTLSDNERIAYVGNGAFAIVEDYKEAGVFKFRIKQKIQIANPRNVK